jgi:hypothetical protein
MSNANESFQLEDLTISVLHEGDTATLRWSGMSEIQAPELSVGPFLQSFVRGLQEQKVIVDFRALEYVNSATLQPILQLIRELNERQIQTTILFDPAMESQRITFRCIKTITKPLSYIHISAEQQPAVS